MLTTLPLTKSENTEALLHRQVKTALTEKEALKKVVNGLSATGGTAGADGLEKAYNVAKSNYIAGGNNRVIIASDGDFNIGRYSQDDLKELGENQLNSGIYLTTLGFGMGNYKDTTMETLAKYGNGGYAYIDNLEQAEKVLVNDLNKRFSLWKKM